MPFADDPVWYDGGTSYSGGELRRADLMISAATGTTASARSGVRPGDPGLTVTLSGTGNRTISVTAGVATIHRTGQGIYRASADAWAGTATTPHASFARVDLVYLRVWDTAIDASGLRQADIVYLAGTPSASPVAPTPGALEIYVPLATITVPVAGSATASLAVRPYTVAPGGILPLLSSQLPAGGLVVGQVYYLTDLDKHVYDTGAAMADLRPQGIGQQQYARKSTTTTIISTAAMASDPHLTLPVAASGTYILESQLVYASDITADLRIGWSLPAGAVLSWSCPGPPTTLTSGSTQDTVKHASLAAADQPSFGGAGTGTALVLHPYGLLRVGGTAGSCVLQWAQAASQAINTSVTSDSFLTLRRVG